MSLYLKWILVGNIELSLDFWSTPTIFLLIDAFRPLTFKVITDIGGLIFVIVGNPLQYSCLENPMDRGASRLQSTGSQRVGHD